MKQNFVWHFLVSLSGMLITATLGGIFQYLFSSDGLWLLTFILLSVFGLVFSSIFAIYQCQLQQSIMNTTVLVALLSICFIVLFYVDLHLKVDWNAISEGKAQLTAFQKFFKSDLGFWLTYLLPFILSFLTYKLKFK